MTKDIETIEKILEKPSLELLAELIQIPNKKQWIKETQQKIKAKQAAIYLSKLFDRQECRDRKVVKVILCHEDYNKLENIGEGIQWNNITQDNQVAEGWGAKFYFDNLITETRVISEEELNRDITT